MPQPPPNSIEVKSREEWRDWLVNNHSSSTGIWLITYKKASNPDLHLTQDEIVEEALCFGWIDSKPAKLDDARTMLYISPRKPKSLWSALNKKRALKMIEQSKMTELGLAAIELAKQSGTWDALNPVDSLTIPDDLEMEFEKFPNAKTNFQSFPPSAQRGILEWILQAKTPQTRTKRIENTAELASQNIRANQWKKPIPSSEE
ncbi:MAG: YdeI/OmpD-associated family protein [Fimbriimonadaceae bacterium]